MTKHFPEPNMYGEQNSSLNNRQVIDFAESYASMAQDYIILRDSEDTNERLRIAKRILDETLPLYRRSVPSGTKHVPQHAIDTDMLESVCLQIVNGPVFGQRDLEGIDNYHPLELFDLPSASIADNRH